MHGGVCWALWPPLTCTLLLKHPTTQISQAKQHRQIYGHLAAAKCVKSENSVARAEKIQFLTKMKGMMLFR